MAKKCGMFKKPPWKCAFSLEGIFCFVIQGFRPMAMSYTSKIHRMLSMPAATRKSSTIIVADEERIAAAIAKPMSQRQDYADTAFSQKPQRPQP